MQTMLLLTCAVAGYTLAQPLIAALRARAATRTQVHAKALRALRTAKGRTYA